MRKLLLDSPNQLTIPQQGLQFYADLWHPEQQGFLLSYDGNDHLQSASNINLGGDAITIESWVRPSAVVFGSVVRQQISSDCIIAGYDNTNHLLSNDTVLAHGITNSGKWQHSVMTWQRNTINGYRSYLNGNLVAQRDSSNTALPSLGTPLFIGSSNVPDEFFTGEIGFTRIYSRPMLQPEAQLNYQRGRKAAASDTTGLVFNLPTTEGTGNPVDTVGSLTMTVTGATWVEGLMDKSTNALPITSFGSPAWGSQGRTFDGVDDHIEVPASPDIISQTQGTLSIWFNTSAASVLFSISDKDTNGLNKLFIQSFTSGSTISIASRAGGFLKYTLRTPVGSYAHNTQYHLVYSSDGSIVRCWLNGTEQTLTVANGANDGSWFGAMSDADNCYIGVLLRNNVFVVPTKGTISEVINWNRPLTQQEITQIYNQTKWRYA